MQERIIGHRRNPKFFLAGNTTSAWLRNAMVEAASTAIRFDPRTKSFYSRIIKRWGRQKAKAAAARQTLEIIWHMLTNSKEYRTQNHELTRQKHKKIKVKSLTSLFGKALAGATAGFEMISYGRAQIQHG